jgi:hypothetical protein
MATKGGYMPKSKAVIILFFILLLSMPVFSQSLMLFGGRNHDVFLGYLNHNQYESDSIWNQYGNFGSKYNSDSIWNQYGTYGSRYSSDSPFNPYAQNPPVIVDPDGNFYGYFTLNRSKNPTRIEWILWVLENHDWIRDNRREAYSMIFR